MRTGSPQIAAQKASRADRARRRRADHLMGWSPATAGRIRATMPAPARTLTLTLTLTLTETARLAPGNTRRPPPWREAERRGNRNKKQNPPTDQATKAQEAPACRTNPATTRRSRSNSSATTETNTILATANRRLTPTNPLVNPGHWMIHPVRPTPTATGSQLPRQTPTATQQHQKLPKQTATARRAFVACCGVADGL